MTEIQINIYNYALRQMEAEKSRIEEQITFVRQQLGVTTLQSVGVERLVAVEVSEVREVPQPIKAAKHFSPAARRRMAAAQRQRWAMYNEAKLAAVPAKKGRKAA